MLVPPLHTAKYSPVACIGSSLGKHLSRLQAEAGSGGGTLVAAKSPLGTGCRPLRGECSVLLCFCASMPRATRQPPSPTPPPKAPHCCDAFPRNLIVASRQRRQDSGLRPHHSPSPIALSASSKQLCHPSQAPCRCGPWRSGSLVSVSSPVRCAHSGELQSLPPPALPLPQPPCIAPFRAVAFLATASCSPQAVLPAVSWRSRRDPAPLGVRRRKEGLSAHLLPWSWPTPEPLSHPSPLI